MMGELVMKKIVTIFLMLSFMLMGCTNETNTFSEQPKTSDFSANSSCQKQISSIRKNAKGKSNLAEKYKDLVMVDAMNHDANMYDSSISTWTKKHIDYVSLSGYVSRESSLLTDELAWKGFSDYPDKFFPSFSGIDIYHQAGIEQTRKNLEQGFMAIGQIAAPSLVSPILATAEWKGKDPMDGNLPAVYKLAAQYRVPVLIHIDPPDAAIDQFEEALDKFPSTTFIFGQSNVANSPESIEDLLKKHSNLYFDFYAGYTAYNPRDQYELKDYAKLLEKFPDKALLSTDSAVELTYDQAINAMYEMIDLLKPETACKVSHQNFLGLMNLQTITETQKNTIQNLSVELGEKHELPKSKIDANKLIFQLSKKMKVQKEVYTSIPDISSIKNKDFSKLSNKDMVSIARDLIRRINIGMWDNAADNQASTDWDSFYHDLYFMEALSDTQQSNYKSIAELNTYKYRLSAFNNESVEKSFDYFIYNAKVNESLKDSTGTETPFVTLYRLLIAFDQNSKTYKLKKALSVDIKR
jgi:predicted TIM-barrel fold metal-dependent hydrolase